MSGLNSSTQIFARAAIGVGTVGGFFKLPDGNIYGITNNHVIANINRCHIGDPVYLPAEEGVDPPMIGTLQHWVTLDPAEVNYLDIALFKVQADLDIGWLLPPGTPMPQALAAPAPDDTVYIVLPDGVKRTGRITNPNIAFNTSFTLCGTDFSFTGLIEIQSQDDRPFVVHRNSGSLLFDSGGNIIGVILGLNFLQTLSYAVPFINGKLGIIGTYNLTITGGPAVAGEDELV